MDARETAIVYCRTSTAGQKDSETIRAQVERDKRLIERHNVRLLKYGPKKDGWLIDDGVSGSLLEGRDFAKFIDDLEAARVRPNYLIVFSLSRVSRLDKSSREMSKLVKSATDNARIKAVLLGAGVKVIDEDGVNDPATVMFDLKTTLSTEEYKLIRQRTMAGKARHLAEGKFAKGGKPPYGYRQVPLNGVDRKQGWTLQPDGDAAANLRRLLAWYVEGGVTHAARKATQAGMPTPMATTANRKNKAEDWTPCRWSPVSVQHIVKNVRVYLGSQTLIFDGVPYEMKYPPLIDTKLYAAVEARRKAKTLKRRATLLSTGYVECSCGGHIHNRNSHGRHHARCTRGCGAMPEKAFTAALWDAAVTRLVQIQEQERTKTDDAGAYTPLVKAAKAKVAIVNEEIGKLVDLYLAGTLDKAVWSGKNNALNDRKAAAVAEVDRLEAERDSVIRRRENEQTVEARVTALLQDIVAVEPALEKKRKVLADLLQGDKAIVAWPKRRGSAAAMLTLPPFGSLPAFTVPIDEKTPWVRKHGWWKVPEVKHEKPERVPAAHARRGDGGRRRGAARRAVVHGPS